MEKKKLVKENTKLSNKFMISETESFSKKLHSVHFCHLFTKLTSFVYPQLKSNPFFGLNIKKLKGKLSNYYRYRIGNYRLFYRIDTSKVIVFVIDISHRKNAY